ncbi:MAG: DUF1572 family protein [Phycisphaerales bacterium]|nr:DUF1572 family protein [Phycisphaerales bacterium]
MLIASWTKTFRAQKAMAERALVQVTDADLHRDLAPGVNPIAVIMKHLHGNMRSRWVDFLTSDGEAPDRNRDDEFVDDHADRATIMRRWEEGWGYLFTALEGLTDEDASRTVTIRGEPHTVADAINRQVSHYAHHVAQIVLMCRIFVGDESWQWLSVPPGGSKAFNASMAKKFPGFGGS